MSKWQASAYVMKVRFLCTLPSAYVTKVRYIRKEVEGRKEIRRWEREEWKRKRGKQERKREEGFIATTMALNCEGNVG